jgi:hypothetical protein
MLEFDFNQFVRDLRAFGYSDEQVDAVGEVAAKMVVDVAMAKSSMAQVGKAHGVNYEAAFDPVTCVFAHLATLAKPEVTPLIFANEEILAALLQIAEEAEFEEL